MIPAGKATRKSVLKSQQGRFTRRSPVVCQNGCVASSQPLASSIGLDFLRKGANAADAAVAVAAVLVVTEPCSTGLGGDMFSLYYDSQSRKISCVNGSGKSPQTLTRDRVVQDCGSDGEINPQEFIFSSHSVTVPGAAKGWEDLLQKHGSKKFTMAELLEPAAELAEGGFPVAPVTAYQWKNGMNQILKWHMGDDRLPLTVDGNRAPAPGDIIRNPDMARVLRDLGKLGATEGFYNGTTGKAIVEAVQKHGGLLIEQDLVDHVSTFPEPISATYRGVELWQVPPNGQGIAGLIALKGLDYLEQIGKCPTITPDSIGSADCLHVMVEMMRLGFQDARGHVTCPDKMQVTHEWLLDNERINKRAEELFNPDRATIHGDMQPSSCTVSFQVVDADGNAISFVNSNFMGFGTGLVPQGCGFTLQNRGFGFDLNANHPNAIDGGKRPYHTIIPGMLTYADSQDLYATFSNMGGNMQPQGHLQLMVGMVAGHLDPQEAIDMPRFCIADGTRDGAAHFEDEIPDEVIEDLQSRGHHMVTNVVGDERCVFGKAQIIKRSRENGVLWAGSDGRADGCAMGY